MSARIVFRPAVTRLRSGLCLVLLCACMGIAQSAPVHVLVKSRELGQGMLFKRADTCYLLTAGHVVRDVTAATVIGTGKVQRFGEARLVARFEAEDIALLRVNGGLTQDCGDEIEVHRTDLGRSLGVRDTGTLAFVFDSEEGGADGGLGRAPIVVTDLGPQWLRVATQRTSDSLDQGRSGSLVLVGGQPAGILVSVEPNGEGKALRFDRAMSLIQRFFDKPQPLAAAVSLAQPGDANASAANELGNLLSAARGASVTAWNSLPSGPEFSPSNLVDGRSNRSWNAAWLGKPIDVDLQFAGRQVQTVGRIEIVLAQDQPPARAAREIEILTSLDGSGWRSVSGATLFSDDPVKVITIAPVRAAYLRLRIYQNWGDPHWVSLRQLRAFTE